MNIILLGAPGSGKGTQAKLLSEKYNFVHISTGQIFRDNIANKTPLGILADSFISKGNLVPDDVTIELVKDTLSKIKSGYILDGFPRTVYQAEKLKEFAHIDRVLLFDVTEEEIKNRLLSRLSCKECGEIYSKKDYTLPKCKKCGGELIIRGDDNIDAIENRIEVYKKTTYPLVEYYEKENLLSVLQSNTTIEEQFERVERELFKVGEMIWLEKLKKK